MSAEPDAAEFVARLAPAVERAARIARDLEGRVVNVPKRDEATAVKQALTDADTAAQEEILATLAEDFPQVALAAEEKTPLAARFPTEGRSLVIVDPIDGTLHSYLGGDGPYAVIVGLAVDRIVRASIVALPREGLLVSAVSGVGARLWREGRDVGRLRAEADGARVLVSHLMPEPVLAALKARGLEIVRACGGAISIAPVLPGVRAGLRWTAYPPGVSARGRVGALIARESGAHVQGDAGAAFGMGLEEPLGTLRVAAAAADLALLDECLRAGGLA